MRSTGPGSLDLRAKLFRGQAEPRRLGLPETLREGPLPVSEVVTRTGLSQPNVSMHLACKIADRRVCPRYRRTAAAHPVRLVPGTRGQR